LPLLKFQPSYLRLRISTVLYAGWLRLSFEAAPVRNIQTYQSTVYAW